MARRAWDGKVEAPSAVFSQGQSRLASRFGERDGDGDGQGLRNRILSHLSRTITCFKAALWSYPLGSLASPKPGDCRGGYATVRKIWSAKVWLVNQSARCFVIT